MEGLIVLPVFFALMWVLFILPQQKRVKAQQQFVSQLSVGDEVVTAGGIHGTVVALEADTVGLEVAHGVELRVARGAINGSQPPTSEADVADTAEPTATSESEA